MSLIAFVLCVLLSRLPSPVREGKRNPSTGGVAAKVIDVSVRSIFVVFVSCATSLARMKGRFRVTLVREDPSCSDCETLLFHCFVFTRGVASPHSLEGSDGLVTSS